MMDCRLKLLLIYLLISIALGIFVILEDEGACKQRYYHPFLYLPNFIEFNKDHILKSGITIKILRDFIIRLLIFIILLPVDILRYPYLLYKKYENTPIYKFKDKSDYIDLRKNNEKDKRKDN